MDAFGSKRPGNNTSTASAAAGEYRFPKATFKPGYSCRNDWPASSKSAEQTCDCTNISGNEIAWASLESHACCGGCTNSSTAAADTGAVTSDRTAGEFAEWPTDY